jgi:general secretion pathway protein G
MNKKIRSNSGFTIIEILAVTLLMSLLIGGAALGISAQVTKGKIRTTRTQIGTFESAIALFEMDCGFYPNSLEDLIQITSGEKCKDFPKDGYLKKKDIPQDPWNEDYSYRKPGTHNTSSFDLWSYGPDKEEGSDDDITNWKAESSEEAPSSDE